MDKSALYDLAEDAIDNVHDMDVRLSDYAKAAVDKLDGAGALLDTAAMQARLGTLEEAGRRIAPPTANVIASVILGRRGWRALVWLYGADRVEAAGATPDAALDAVAALLAERHPDNGWATLGVSPSGEVLV